MPEVRGFVHRVKIVYTGAAIVYIGPDRSDVESFAVVARIDDPPEAVAAFASMTDALSAALLARREVLVGHTSSRITRVEIEGP